MEVTLSVVCSFCLIYPGESAAHYDRRYHRMNKLGVKTGRYANTELYTPDPIDDEGNGTIELDGLKYGFESGFQFYRVNVPRPWMNPTGEFEKWVGLMCTKENRLNTWEEIEDYYFNECLPVEEDEEELADRIFASY